MSEVVGSAPEQSIPTVSLMRAIDEVSFTVGRDKKMPMSGCVLLEFKKDGLRLVTTDGYRLSASLVRTTPQGLEASQGRNLIVRAQNLMGFCGAIPGRLDSESAVNIVLRENSISLSPKEQKVSFIIPRTTNNSSFEWQKLVPRHYDSVVVLTKELLKRLRGFGSNTVSISSSSRAGISLYESPSSALATVLPALGRISHRVTLDTVYMQHLLENIAFDWLRIEVAGPKQPVAFRDATDPERFIHLIKPRKVTYSSSLPI